MVLLMVTAAAVGTAGVAHASVGNAPGYVHLKSVDPGTCIDAKYNVPGTQVVMWRCLNTEFEEWRTVNVSIPGNRYEHCACATVTTFVNHAMDLCLAVPSDTIGSGTAVVQQTCNPADEKQWWMWSGSAGAIRTFINLQQTLDVDLGRSDNGIPLQTWTNYSLRNQQWSTL